MKTFSYFLILIFLLTTKFYAQWTKANGPCAGSILCIAANETEMYVGTGGGGVYRSTDGGVSFTYANSNMWSTTITALYLSSTGIMAGTGGSGAFFSQDHGVTWQQESTGLTQGTVNSLASIGSYIFAATQFGVLRTSDNGKNWTMVNTGLTQLNVTELFANGTTLYAGTSNGIFESNDEGLNWTDITSNLTNKNISAIKIIGNRIFVGNNNGVSFADLPTTSYGNFSAQSINAINWNNPSVNINKQVKSLENIGSTLFASSGNGCSRSNDNGSTWSTCSADPFMNFSGNVLQYQNSKLFYGGFGLWTSVNAGNTWQNNVNDGIAFATVNGILNTNDEIYAGIYGSGIAKSTDDGNTWTFVNNGITSTDISTFISYEGAIIAGSGIDNKGVFWSSNGGASWENYLNGKAIFGFDAVNGGPNGTQLFAATSDGIYMSPCGKVWTKNTQVPSNVINDICFNGPNGICARYGLYNPYITTNYGVTWTQTQGKPPSNCNAFEIIGNEFIAGTYYGIYHSTDQGANWSTYDDLPFLNVNGMRRLTQDEVIAASQTDGCYRYNAATGVWVPINEGLPSWSNTIYDFSTNGNNVAAGFFGGVLISTTNLIHEYGSRFTITATPEDATMGSASGGGTFNKGEKAKVTAIPNEGYVFKYWREGIGWPCSYDAEYEFVVDRNRDLIAVFECITYEIKTAPNDTARGTTNPDVQRYCNGQDCEVKAVAKSGYYLKNWTEGGVQVSTYETYKFKVNKDRELIANFEKSKYHLYTYVVPDNAGTTTGDGEYEYLAEVPVTATPNAGYTFKEWRNGRNLETSWVISGKANFTHLIKYDDWLYAHFEIIKYNIELSAKPTDGGTTSGGGPHDWHSTVTVKATPHKWYVFVNWTENGEVVSTDSVYQFTAERNRNLVANFKLKKVEITTYSNPPQGGKTSGDGEYYAGIGVTVKAEPAGGYVFVKWTDEWGETVSENAEYYFIAMDSRKLTAHFTIEQFFINATADPFEGGYTSGGGYFYWGDLCSLEAKAKAGYRFAGWYENDKLIWIDPNFSFSVEKSRNLVAKFVQQREIRITGDPASGGTGTGAGWYDRSSEVIVEAAPAYGYEFEYWTEGIDIVSYNATYYFNIESDMNLVAHFKKKKFNVETFSNPVDGGTTGGGGSYDYESTVTVTAVQANGFSFVCWISNGECVSNSQTYSFTLTKDIYLMAVFSEQGKFTITTGSNPIFGGTTSGGDNYDPGSMATVSAEPSSNFEFLNWTEDDVAVSTMKDYTFSVDKDRNLIANFKGKLYTITTSSDPANGGTTSGGGSFPYNSEVTVEAAANPGFKFLYWSENEIIVSRASAYSFSVTEDRNLVANFQKAPVTIQTGINPLNSGVTQGAGVYLIGDDVTVTAIPMGGFSFVSWTENNAIVSNDAVYKFAAAGDRILTANFKATVIINTGSNPIVGGVTAGGGAYGIGDLVTVTATPNPRYGFINWTENGISQSFNAVYNFNANANRNLVANFTQSQSTIVTISKPDTGGTTKGNGTYFTGSLVTVSATPNTGFVFDKWTENNIKVSDTANYSFNILSNRVLVANFNPEEYNVSISSIPENCGTTTGAGKYKYGEMVQVKAAAYPGYIFSNWTENNVELTKNDTYSFKIVSDRNLVANFIGLSSVKQEDGIPTEYSLSQNYPNPFNPVSRIKFGLPEECMVTLTVYNIIGEEVMEIINQQLSAGMYSVGFDLSGLTNGIYIYRIQTKNFNQTKKMLLLK